MCFICVSNTFATARTAAVCSAATLGVVTFPANNHSVPSIGTNGYPCVKICRDSLPRQGTALRRRVRRPEVAPPARPPLAPTPVPALARQPGLGIKCGPPNAAACSAKKRRLILATEAAQSRRVDAERVARWISERQIAPARGGPNADSRMEQLRRRLQDKSESRVMGNV